MPYAVVTGASQGMGKVIAEKLLNEGFSIAVCARNQRKLSENLASWKKQFPGRQIISRATDLSKKEEVSAFGDLVLADFPGIDILVNNAGTYLPGNLADEPDGLLETLTSTNLYSAYWLTRKLLPAFISKQAGHIFNMCSVASLKAYPNGGAYSISKYALMGFSENLREELRPFNIKVTSICPGATYTPSWEGSGVATERIMEANDVAAMLFSAYLLSPQACVETLIMRPVKGDL